MISKKDQIDIIKSIFAYKILKKRTSLQTRLTVTNKCNSRCNYCNYPNRIQEELTTEQIFDLIDQLVRNGTKRLLLYGGEPLVRKDIWDIVDYAKKSGLYVSLISNGYLVKKNIDKINKLDLLVLSFDGPEKAHDSNREKGSYKKVTEAIKIASKKVNLATITILTKNNIEYIDYILEEAKKHGFFTTFQIVYRDKQLESIPDTDSLLASNEEYKDAVKKIISEKKKGAPIASSYEELNYLLNWPDYSISFHYDKNKKLKCLAGKLFCNIDADGRVYPCPLLIGKMEAENFLNIGFQEALNSIKNIPCSSCVCGCFYGISRFYSLHPKTVLESLHYYK